MIPTLLVFSLLLHFVTFYIIIVLFQRMNHLKSQPDGDTFTNLDELLQAHLEAVREENQALIDSIERSKINYTVPFPKVSEPSLGGVPVKPKMEEKDNRKIEKPVIHETKPIIPTNKVEDEPLYTPPVDKIVDQVERSSSAEVLHLHEKGYSSQEIAKKLNIGKGEVELMLNLNRKRPR